MQRRTFIAGTAAAVAAGSAGAQEMSNEKKTYVLVHGTWHGGWMWQKMVPYMTAAGHRVTTPTMTGCGERVHLTAPDVNLDTHINDLCNHILFEELDDIILVGHSFAGLTITGAADRLRERIRHIVFFDALVPREGVMSGVRREEGPDGDWPDYWKRRREKFLGGWQMVFWEEYPVEMILPAEDAENIEWVKRRITTHPAGQWEQELVLNNGGWEGLPRTYIYCSGQVYSPSSPRMAGPAYDNPDWNWIDLPYHRNAMMTHPKETAEALMGIG